MPDLAPTLGTFLDFLQVVIGFSLIIIIHELGHFVAARWAGVRVMAFAVGFGPAIFSYRKGLGFRRGSSERLEGAQARGRKVSPTEYRLNWLPLGGYVKMLGQDDADPTATSDEPDSYQNCAVWKRMVIISAGVVFNLITAALLFIIVFMAGLKTAPPQIGLVFPDGPAAEVFPVNADAAGVETPGLQPGDTVLRVDGSEAEEFTDITVGAAMAAPDEAIELEVKRAGVEETLVFRITPERDKVSGLLDIGATPARSTRLGGPDLTENEQRGIRIGLDQAGLPGVKPGMALASINDRKAASAFDLRRAIKDSGGESISVTFEGESGQTVEATIRPQAQIQTALLANGQPVSHLLGFPSLLRVSDVVEERASASGLRQGDIFSRLGGAEWPVISEAISQIQGHAGQTIEAEVMRHDADGWSAVPLELSVSKSGTIGFHISESAPLAAYVASWPDVPLSTKQEEAWQQLRPALDLGSTRGWRILAVNGEPVESLLDLRDVLRAQTRTVFSAGETESAATVTLRVERPAHPERVAMDVPWTLDARTLELLHDQDKLGWVSPLPIDLFAPEEITLKADGPASAVAMGLRKTHRVMTMTYLTFVRLFQGSVKVEHLKGPVGIAHVGTVIADRGLVWLLFFMALISVNLAVINFLPIPIADGGHFVFLLYEQITGRPPPVAVQNAAAIAGLVLIASVFLIVTFNDIRNLL